MTTPTYESQAELRRIQQEYQDILVKPAGEIFRPAIHKEAVEKLGQVQLAKNRINPEPASPIGVSRVIMRTVGFLEENSINIQPLMELHPTRTASGAKREKHIVQDLGFDYLKMGRTGGGFLDVALAQVANQSKWPTEVLSAGRIYDDCLDEMHRRYCYLIDLDIAYAMEALTALESDPALVIADKDESVGTGWTGNLGTRGDMARNLPSVINTMYEPIKNGLENLKTAVMVYPQYDALFHFRHPRYKAIRGGRRSKCDFVSYTWEMQVVAGKSRHVGNMFDSFLHNKLLMNKARRDDLFMKFTSRYSLPPQDIQSHARIMTTPPITECTGNEIGLLSADFGYTEPPARLERVADKWRIIQPHERVKLGADQIALAGRFCTVYGESPYTIKLLESGDPRTMIGYKILAELPMETTAQRHGLDLKWMAVGDDLHIIGRGSDLEVLMNERGNWLRLKGMTPTPKGTWVFILGFMLFWQGNDYVHMFVIPRAVSSKAAAVRSDTQLRPMRPYDEIDYKVPPEALMQVEELERLHPELLMFEGTPEELSQVILRQLPEANRELPKLNISEWRREMPFSDPQELEDDLE